MQIPVWVVALVLAASAPLVVRGIAAWLAARARARTLAALERAARDERDTGTDRPG